MILNLPMSLYTSAVRAKPLCRFISAQPEQVAVSVQQQAMALKILEGKCDLLVFKNSDPPAFKKKKNISNVSQMHKMLQTTEDVRNK